MADEELTRHVFALASSLIVSVFIEKTMPLKTLVRLLVCAPKGFDRVRRRRRRRRHERLEKPEPQTIAPICLGVN